MPVLNDSDIRKYCTNPIWLEALGGPMIDPFSEGVSGDNRISFGLSSAGYDIRMGREVFCLKSSFGEVIDPKRFREPGYRERVMDHREYDDGDRVIVPTNGYILVSSLEYFRIPSALVGRVVGKSTYARVGLSVNVTPLEPGWNGNLTIEIGNAGPAPVCVYVSEGIAQLQFEMLTSRPDKSYADKHDGKSGKYQGQQGVTLAKVL